MADLRISSRPEGSGDQQILAKGKINNRQDLLVVLLFLLLISLFEVHTLQIIQAVSLNAEIQGAHGLLFGHPEYRVFQNRVLGPLLALAVSKVTGSSYALAYENTLTALFTIPVVLIFYFVQKLTGHASKGLFAAGAFAVMTILLQDKSWFCIWDAIDFTTMMVFAYAVFNGKGDLKLLVPLFGAELLNRESAAFIALWICIRASADFFSAKERQADRGQSIVRLCIGIILLAAGSVWVHTLRKMLFISSFKKSIGIDLKHSADGQWVTILQNLSSTAVYGDVAAYTIAVICCLAIGVMIYRMHKIAGKQCYPIGALLVVMALAVWTFGSVTETRVWLNFIPFGIFYYVSIEDVRSIRQKAVPSTRLAA